ncbi:MAG TPA: cysteine desulfurase family protein [Candidatus Paceibacterota bacterium]|jgi:cysteine desulfurase
MAKSIKSSYYAAMFGLLPKKRIYLDYAASTPLDQEVKRAMLPYFSKHFGNPGSIHREGRVAAEAIADARERIARILDAHANEIIFTASGTEANNLAIYGVVRASNQASPHIVTTSIEHPSVMEPVRSLEQGGARVTYLGVDDKGRVRSKELRSALTKNTMLVSIMLVNNEIGSIQPLREIMKVIRKHRHETGGVLPYVHTDASQAPLFLLLSLEKLGVDLLTLDGQKLYGPKGIGLLYKKRTAHLVPQLMGGEQEGGLRPGTENTPLIVGMARALELAEMRREHDNRHLSSLQDYFFSSIVEAIPSAIVNGGTEDRVPNNVNISIPGLESAFMVVWLDARGIACGSRSACTNEKDEPSYVIRAMGNGEKLAGSSLRFTLGRMTTRSDIARAVGALSDMVRKLTNT